MPLIAQICMVVVTIAVAGLAVTAIRLMRRTYELIATANRSLAEVPGLIEETRRASARVDELLQAFSQISRSARAGATQFEQLADRSSAMASSLLDEVEGPLSQTVGLFRGIRAGVNHLIRGWVSPARVRPGNDEGADHGGEQRWIDDGGAAAGRGGRGGIGAAARTDVR